MERISIHTYEELHHVCLMYGLKNTYERFPFLARNIMATPPPVRRKPERTSPLLGWKRNPVNVQYYKNDILILYNTEPYDVLAFAKALLEEYLILRHPYMKTSWEEMTLREKESGHVIADIITEFPETGDKL